MARLIQRQPQAHCLRSHSTFSARPDAFGQSNGSHHVNSFHFRLRLQRESRGLKLNLEFRTMAMVRYSRKFDQQMKLNLDREAQIGCCRCVLKLKII
jgi:hypothetical protein